MGRSIQTSLTFLLNNADLAVAQESPLLNIKQMEGYSAQYEYTSGTPGRAVTIELQGSNLENGTYTVIDSYTIDDTSGSRLINVEFPRYNFVKVKTTVGNAGGGTLLATISGRGLD
jgi:hypothetical protein